MSDNKKNCNSSLTAFGRELRKLLIDLDVSHAELASLLHCTKSWLSAVEHGKSRVPDGLVDRLSSVLPLTDAQAQALRQAAASDAGLVFKRSRSVHDNLWPALCAFHGHWERGYLDGSDVQAFINFVHSLDRHCLGERWVDASHGEDASAGETAPMVETAPMGDAEPRFRCFFMSPIERGAHGMGGEDG